MPSLCKGLLNLSTKGFCETRLYSSLLIFSFFSICCKTTFRRQSVVSGFRFGPNNNRIPNYFRLDFSIKYQFQLSPKVKAQLGGSILNLTNNTNIYNIYYKGENEALVKVRQLALGITPNMMFRVNF